MYSVTFADGRFERTIVPARHLDRLTCGQLCLALGWIGFSTCESLLPNVTWNAALAPKIRCFSIPARIHQKMIDFGYRLLCLLARLFLLYSTPQRVALNHRDTLWDFILRTSCAPINTQKLDAFFGIGHSQTRNTRDGDFMSLHLVYGEGVHRSKLLPECCQRA